MKATSTNTITARLSALADDLRLRAARVLECEELTVGELASVLQLPQSTASRNLKALADAGWLRSRQVGTSTLYRLTLDDLGAADRAIWIVLRGELDHNADVREDARRLCAVLAKRTTDSAAYFGRIAGEWDDIRNELFGTGFTAAALLSLLPSEWAVADLGCGTGNASAHLSPHVREVFAVDQSAPMLESAARQLAGLTNVRFVEGTLGSLPLKDGTIDASVAILVLHHVSDLESAFRDIRRITRTGGISLVVDMYEHSRDDYRDTMGHRHLGFSESHLTDIYTSAGFEPPRITPIPSSTKAMGPSLFVATARAC